MGFFGGFFYSFYSFRWSYFCILSLYSLKFHKWMTFDIDLLWNVVYVLVFNIPPPLAIDWFDPWSIICIDKNIFETINSTWMNVLPFLKIHSNRVLCWAVLNDTCITCHIKSKVVLPFFNINGNTKTFMCHKAATLDNYHILSLKRTPFFYKHCINKWPFATISNSYR